MKLPSVILKKDHSWEDNNRRLERLLSDLFANTTTRDHFKFDWVSARMDIHTINVSYSKNGEQRLFKFQRDKKSDDKTMENAKVFIKEQLNKIN